MVLFVGNSPVEFFINLTVPGVNTTITDHLVMLFRNVPDEPLYELHNRDGFFHILAIFMPVVVESDKVAIILVNPGRGDDRAPEITSNVLYNSFWITFVWLGIYIEAFFMLPVASGFDFFKGRTDFSFHFIEKRSTKSITKVCIVKMADIPPETVIAVSTFRDETVDMGIPFQIPAKGVENHDKAGSEVHGLVLLKKHAGNNAVYSMKKAVKEGTVIEEKLPESRINGKNAMAVDNMNQFKGHRGDA